MNECVNSENVGRVEELLAMTEQMQDELDQKDQTILELNSQLSESLTLNEKLNSENRAENIEALRTRLRQTEEQLTSETDSRKRADAEVVAWKFKYEKAEQAKRYAQTHQKTVEVSVEKKVPCSCWHGTAQLPHCLMLSSLRFSLTTLSFFSVR